MIGSRWICIRVWPLYKARERFPPFYGSRASSSLTSRAEHLRQIFVKEKKISDDLSEIAGKKIGFFFFSVTNFDCDRTVFRQRLDFVFGSSSSV
jgi:hypothetical protein